MNEPIVSIVIVCMNNLKNLYPCLESIRKHTEITYETLVVAYLFSESNLKKLQKDYPWVKIIESSEIRGFSENNNLALRQAKGRFCFILNDDTLFDTDVIGILYRTISELPDNVAIVSPVTLNKDGSVQRNGRPKYNMFTYFLELLKIIKYYDNNSKYTNKTGIYQTYNITGAAFLIKTSVFRTLGWFDERYFFCPEDIALSTEINKRGLKCYVNTKAKIVHLRGETWSKIHTATKPTIVKGQLIFYGNNNFFKECVFLLLIYLFYSIYLVFSYSRFLFNKNERNKIMYQAHLNTLCTIGMKLQPKQIFINYYKKINQQ